MSTQESDTVDSDDHEPTATFSLESPSVSRQNSVDFSARKVSTSSDVSEDSSPQKAKFSLDSSSSDVGGDDRRVSFSSEVLANFNRKFSLADMSEAGKESLSHTSPPKMPAHLR